MDNENIESTPEQSEIKEEEIFINDEITEEFGEGITWNDSVKEIIPDNPKQPITPKGRMIGESANDDLSN